MKRQTLNFLCFFYYVAISIVAFILGLLQAIIIDYKEHFDITLNNVIFYRNILFILCILIITNFTCIKFMKSNQYKTK